MFRVLSWNLYHGRDGKTDLGPDRASRWLGRPRFDATHVHLNRKLVGAMGGLIAARAPDVAALQEVPTGRIAELTRAAGMRAVWTWTGPLIGPRALRDRLADWNPDVWQSHEGNANVILVREPWRIDHATVVSVRLNPTPGSIRAARRAQLPRGELIPWLREARRVLLVRVSGPHGARVGVACVHCSTNAVAAGIELARLAEFVRARVPWPEPLMLAGDFNVHARHEGIDALRRALDIDAHIGDGIDQILARGLGGPVAGGRLDPRERDVMVSWRGARRRLRLSDHDPVEASLG